MGHHHAAAGADAQPRGKDDSRDGPQDVDGGKAYVPDALADEKPSTMIKNPVRSWDAMAGMT